MIHLLRWWRWRMVGDVLSSRFACLSFFECLTTQTHYKSEKNKKPTKTSSSKIRFAVISYRSLSGRIRSTTNRLSMVYFSHHTTSQRSKSKSKSKEQMITMDKRRKLSNINLWIKLKKSWKVKSRSSFLFSVPVTIRI